MHCEIVQGNDRVRGPFIYDSVKLSRLLKRLGYPISTLPATLTAPIQLGSQWLMPVTINRPTPTDHHDVEFLGRTQTAVDVTYEYQLNQRDIQALRGQMKERIAGRHCLYELDYADIQSVAIKTDLEARINAAEILDAYRKGKSDKIKWRGKNGKIDVETEADMQAIYNAIFGYLEIGFAAKEVAEDSVDNATDQELFTLDPVSIFDQTVAFLKGAST